MSNEPENRISLPAHARMMDRDYTIREIRCDKCGAMLVGLVIPDEHQAKFVWPFTVSCQPPVHVLQVRDPGDPANTTCFGRAARQYEVDKFLEPHQLPEKREAKNGLYRGD